MIREASLATLYRWREVAAAAGLGAAGLWLMALGGLVLIPAGAALLAVAAVLGVTGWRRLRFRQDTLAPGVVEVDEGQIGYLGPGTGGFVSLPDLVEIKLVTLRGHRLWRLKQSDGQALLVPVDATGADRLFEAFSALPGIDLGALVDALAPAQAGTGGTAMAPADVAQMRLVWRRQGEGIVAR